MEEEREEQEYREAAHKFYSVYRPMQKKYNLRYHIHFDIYDDGLIEIWEYKGERRGKCICRVSESKDIDCYEKAIMELEAYEKKSAGDHKRAQANGMGGKSAAGSNKGNVRN